MDLNIIPHGQETALPPLLIVHGLFGSARNWGAIAKRLSDSRLVWAVDMRNHAGSPHAPTHGYDDLAGDLARVIARMPARPDVLGHSMGGKAAMVLALTRPDLVHRLVVADIAPVSYGHSQRHLIAAMRGLDMSGVTTRGEADRRLSLTVPDAQVRAFLLQSLDLQADPPRWRLGLDVLDAQMDRITGWPEGPFAPCHVPTLFVAGAQSDYIRPEHRETIRALFPAARQVKIPGAGHWLHAEKPREFEAAVRAFLS
jgi:esterase